MLLANREVEFINKKKKRTEGKMDSVSRFAQFSDIERLQDLGILYEHFSFGFTTKTSNQRCSKLL